MIRSVTDEITKENIKLISHYQYGVVVYNFTHPNKWNIQSFFKGMCKDSLYVCVCKGKKEKKKEGIFKVFVNLKTNENQMVNN